MNIQSSFTVYTAALHALILNPLLFAYYWLGLSWSDLEWLYFIKTKLFISKNKQQETLHQQQAAGEAKHSAENTINFSGSKRQPVSVHRQRPRAVQPVLRAGKYKQKGGLRWTQEEWTPT